MYSKEPEVSSLLCAFFLFDAFTIILTPVSKVTKTFQSWHPILVVLDRSRAFKKGIVNSGLYY